MACLLALTHSHTPRLTSLSSCPGPQPAGQGRADGPQRQLGASPRAARRLPGQQLRCCNWLCAAPPLLQPPAATWSRRPHCPSSQIQQPNRVKLAARRTCVAGEHLELLGPQPPLAQPPLDRLEAAQLRQTYQQGGTKQRKCQRKCCCGSGGGSCSNNKPAAAAAAGGGPTAGRPPLAKAGRSSGAHSRTRPAAPRRRPAGPARRAGSALCQHPRRRPGTGCRRPARAAARRRPRPAGPRQTRLGCEGAVGWVGGRVGVLSPGTSRLGRVGKMGPAVHQCSSRRGGGQQATAEPHRFRMRPALPWGPWSNSRITDMWKYCGKDWKGQERRDHKGRVVKKCPAGRPAFGMCSSCVMHEMFSTHTQQHP